MKSKQLLITILLIFSNWTLKAQPGTLDKSYGNNGKASIPNGTSYDIAKGMALQKDGKPVLVGYAVDDIMLSRFTTNGHADSTFGNNGIVITDVNNGSAENANAVAIQTDGKIVVCGSDFNNNNRNFLILRYLPNGNLDNTFSGDGKLMTKISAGLSEPLAIAIQSDGKILAAGYSEGKFALVRYTTKGQLDSSFSKDGIVITAPDSGIATAYSVQVLKNGKILLAGYVEFNNQADAMLVKYHADGRLDSSFGRYGKVVADMGATDRIYTSLIQSDDKILVAGTVYSSDFNIGIARFNTSGALDTSFSQDGVTIVTYGKNHSSKAMALTQQPDGKIVIAGTDFFSGYDFALVRLDARGLPDNTFGLNGKVSSNFGNINVDEAIGVAILADGKILVGGDSDGDIICARYLSGLKLNISDKRIIKEFSIYPNPCSGNTTITFNNPESNKITIEILDAQGKLIASPITNQALTEGIHQFNIQLPENLPFGIYCIQLLTDTNQYSRKLILTQD